MYISLEKASDQTVSILTSRRAFHQSFNDETHRDGKRASSQMTSGKEEKRKW